MDIVYFYKARGSNAIELKYSLRSLINIPHDKVFIIGDIPSRCTNVIHIPFNDKEGKKYDNVRRKRKKILAIRSCSEDFILMNDDFYILRPTVIETNYISGSLKDHYEEISSIGHLNDYGLALQNTYNQFPDGNNFETHTPFLMNKSLLKKSLDWKPDITGAKRSMYANYNNLPGVLLTNTPKYKRADHSIDCKIFSEDQCYTIDGQLFLSSSNEVASSKKFFALINGFFPNKSVYEKK